MITILLPHLVRRADCKSRSVFVLKLGFICTPIYIYRPTYEIMLSNKASGDMNTALHAKYHKNAVTQWTDPAISNFGDRSYAPSYL